MSTVWMQRVMAAGLGIVAAIVLAASIAVASSTLSSPTGVALTHKQILQIALQEARESEDPHPERIEMAPGPAKAALGVMDPTATVQNVPNDKEMVDLVAMHGYFHLNAPHPQGTRIAPGKVMELMIGAYSGFVEARSLYDRVPVPLSRLGLVTRLR